MGRIIINTYKNLFLTPVSEDDTRLQVFMNSKLLCQEVFRMESNKENIKDIFIYSGELDQQNFNSLINVIKTSTDKPTNICFAGAKDYSDKVSNFKYKYNHFPDNITISHTLVELDENKDHLIKKGLHL